MENIYFETKCDGDRLTFEFKKECVKVDAKNFQEIEELAKAEIDAHSGTISEVEFDLSNVTYVSSAGLRMFSAINSVSQDHGLDYSVVNLRKDILKMFQLTGYSSIFRTIEKPEYGPAGD